MSLEETARMAQKMREMSAEAKIVEHINVLKPGVITIKTKEGFNNAEHNKLDDIFWHKVDDLQKIYWDEDNIIDDEYVCETHVYVFGKAKWYEHFL